MKLLSENDLFTMLKWVSFDQRFESQTFHVIFEPLNHFSLLNALKGTCAHPKLSPETINSKVWVIISEGLLLTVLCCHLLSVHLSSPFGMTSFMDDPLWFSKSYICIKRGDMKWSFIVEVT